jgi:3-hydroxypropanoate dehydrogenase
MAATPAQASLETSLTRLNDDGRALLLTEARTANTLSDRPVTGAQLREIHEPMKWGPTWSNTLSLRIVYVTTPDGKARLLPHLQPGNVGKATQAPVNAILAVDSAFHHQIPRLFPFRAGMRDARSRPRAAGQDRHRRHMDAGRLLHHRRPSSRPGRRAYGRVRHRRPRCRVLPIRGLAVIPHRQHRYSGQSPWYERLPRLDYAEAVRHA